MRFSILFLFLVFIVGMAFWQFVPQEDPEQAAADRIMKKLRREAYLKDQREKMNDEERKKDFAKLQRQHPKLLDDCGEKVGYRRSGVYIHKFNNGSKLAFCAFEGEVDLNKFEGRIYYQWSDRELPQIFEIGDGSDGPPGFDTGEVKVTFTFDGFHADEKIFYNYALVPAYRKTFTCNVVTKECSSNKQPKCALSKEEKSDEAYIAQFNVTEFYRNRIDPSDKELYELFFRAVGGDRAARKAIVQDKVPTINEEEIPYDPEMRDLFRAELQSFRRAGCL